MTRNREQTIEIVTQCMCNLTLRESGITIGFTDNGDDYMADFHVVYLYGLEHIMAGIDDVGMVSIEDVSGWPWDEYKKHVHDFVLCYFDYNDLLRNVQEFTIEY